MTRFETVFGRGKPVIAMVHLGALPGTPLHDAAGGVEAILDGAARDLAALQAAGVDAVMFGTASSTAFHSLGVLLGRRASRLAPGPDLSPVPASRAGG